MEGWIDLGYLAVHRPGIELAISQSQVRHLNYYITEQARAMVNFAGVETLSKQVPDDYAVMKTTYIHMMYECVWYCVYVTEPSVWWLYIPLLA